MVLRLANSIIVLYLSAKHLISDQFLTRQPPQNMTIKHQGMQQHWVGRATGSSGKGVFIIGDAE
jgi:hypothetical protein